jgi:hypothetical protein
LSGHFARFREGLAERRIAPIGCRARTETSVARINPKVDTLTIEVRTGFDRVERRLGRIETRVEDVEKRVTAVEGRPSRFRGDKSVLL